MRPWRSPRIVISFWGLAACALLASGPIAHALPGLLAWPVVEYSAHRWGLHALAKRVHMAHHRHPRDLSHFPVPILIAVAAALLIAGLLTLLGVGLVPLGGLLAAYAIYDLAHLAAHGLAPFPFRRSLVRRHKRHHADPTVNFGVTTSWIDRLLRTYAP